MKLVELLPKKCSKKSYLKTNSKRISIIEKVAFSHWKKVQQEIENKIG